MAAEDVNTRMLPDGMYPARDESGRLARGLEHRTGRGSRPLAALIKKLAPPLAAFIVFVGGWQLICYLLQAPTYLVPKPSDIVQAAIENRRELWTAVSTTAFESVFGFLLSIVLGISFAILMASSKVVEESVYPYAIIMQTIPIVAVAPLIVIWFDAGFRAIVIIAFLIGFFPMLSNTQIGLNSTEHNLRNLFYLYNAKPLQTMWRLRIPAALPYIVAGLKISCTLSVIGAIVGEYIAGIGGGNGGLGYAITYAAGRLKTPYLFACGLSASLLGILFFLLVNLLAKWMLSSWHESEMKREG
ncbi:ABC transporter permease [Paenibacillus sp. GCM10023250]|uniref:ABC transporter permease n=1 Tax=Paenibacillus sp. GCM10023250 TaxID=3252648 RepID=UPI0036104B19